MTKKNHDIIDLEVKIKRETDLAVLVATDKGEAWLPKSQIEIEADGTIQIPEWLALDKGLI